MSVKQTLTILAAMSLLSGCTGAILGNLIVLGITVGIFLGTLSLGRHAETARSAEESSTTRS